VAGSGPRNMHTSHNPPPIVFGQRHNPKRHSLWTAAAQPKPTLLPSQEPAALGDLGATFSGLSRLSRSPSDAAQAPATQREDSMAVLAGRSMIAGGARPFQAVSTCRAADAACVRPAGVLGVMPVFIVDAARRCRRLLHGPRQQAPAAGGGGTTRRFCSYWIALIGCSTV
jgi:hypothetical protein